MVFKTIALNHSATSPTVMRVSMWRTSSYHIAWKLSITIERFAAPDIEPSGIFDYTSINNI